MTLHRPRWPLVVAVVAAVVAGLLVWSWETSSGEYAFLPDTAHPTTSAVHVKGGHPPQDGTGIYFVDVKILDANKLEAFWARHFVDGATLVPARELLAPGQSDQQRIQAGYQQMAESQKVAPVVAERALGRRVPIAHLGARVVALAKGLPAARAGIRPGDLIVGAQGRPVHSAADLIAATAKLHPGDVVTLRVRRSGSVRLKTVADPSDRSRAIVGISIEDAIRIGRLPVPVRFSTPGIGGPSAGLAFALEIYRSLSPQRNLLRGHKIAVTGEIDLGGHVYPIGGVDQKTVGAIDAGADTFLVPAGSNFRDARRTAHGRLHVVAVRSFTAALRVIRGLAPR